MSNFVLAKIFVKNLDKTVDAIKYLNGQFINGEQVYVGLFIKKEQPER